MPPPVPAPLSPPPPRSSLLSPQEATSNSIAAKYVVKQAWTDGVGRFLRNIVFLLGEIQKRGKTSECKRTLFALQLPPVAARNRAGARSEPSATGGVPVWGSLDGRARTARAGRSRPGGGGPNRSDRSINYADPSMLDGGVPGRGLAMISIIYLTGIGSGPAKADGIN
jgi:hypothetical protein